MSAADPSSRISPALSPARVLLIVAGGGLLLWNAITIARLGDRLEILEATSSSAAERLDSGSELTARSQPGRARPSGTGFAFPGDGDPVHHLDNLKESQEQISPAEMARDFDSRLAMEPANHEQERRAQQWLMKAQAATQGDDAPRARNVATTCRGQRCLTSASFRNDADAQAWATQYLLNAGGNILGNSRTVILPAQNGGSVTLQLYQF